MAGKGYVIVLDSNEHKTCASWGSMMSQGAIAIGVEGVVLDGDVRYLTLGNLPFNKELLDFNREKLEERARFEKREISFNMVVDDIYAVSKGKLIGRP